MQLHRVIVFCAEPKRLAGFYGDAFGFEVLADEGTFIDIGIKDSPSSRIAFHKGKREATRSVKICFYTPDVEVERERLVGQGAKMGKIQRAPQSLCFCDGKDPEGNVFQITNRA